MAPAPNKKARRVANPCFEKRELLLSGNPSGILQLFHVDSTIYDQCPALRSGKEDAEKGEKT
ncbi:hypothetical protein [Falsochrobactrum shanghaiense]|uniref:hypothetical protein n=1 Tax=Falsochrobactrum shanghaiense TaxID=2201899 RepID=UPI0018EE5743|nr:hypothetical protein [Falsochrobactrum shanghaiense]